MGRLVHELKSWQIPSYGVTHTITHITNSHMDVTRNRTITHTGTHHSRGGRRPALLVHAVGRPSPVRRPPYM